MRNAKLLCLPILALLLSACGVIAILLASLGLYGAYQMPELDQLLGDREAHVLDHRVGQLQRLREGAQDVPHDGDVLGPRGEGEADV